MLLFLLWTKNLKSFEIKKKDELLGTMENELKTWKVLKLK